MRKQEIESGSPWKTDAQTVRECFDLIEQGVPVNDLSEEEVHVAHRGLLADGPLGAWTELGNWYNERKS